MWLAESIAKKSIKLSHTVILEDSLITIGQGIKEKYTLHWDNVIYDLPEVYVNEEFLKIISND